MPSICFVNDFFLRDESVVTTGPMVQMYLIGKELAQRGWQVSHVATTKNGKSGRQETYDGTSVHYLTHYRYGELLNTLALWQKLREVNADFYCQRGRSPLTGLTAYFAKQHGKKFIWSAAGETGLARNKYTRERLPKKQGLRKMLIYPYFWLQDRVYAYGIERAHLVLVQTAHQLRELETIFHRRGIVIRSGHEAPPAKILKKPQPPIVLWIGALKAAKQPQLFLELAERLSAETARFVMIGHLSDKRYGAAIARRQKEQKNFCCFGEVPFEKTSEWLAQAAVVINTTIPGYEGLPNVFVQAWLHGAPVVSLHADPDDSTKKHGIGYHAGDFEGMVAKVRELIRNHALREKMSRHARGFAIHEFGIKGIVDRMIKLLEQA